MTMFLQAAGTRLDKHHTACCTSTCSSLCRRVMQPPGVEADAHLHGVLSAAVSGAWWRRTLLQMHLDHSVLSEPAVYASL